MAQVIELPGEANPLSLQNVQNALALAASSTQQQVQTGAQQLQNWEKEENYYTFLQVHWSYAPHLLGMKHIADSCRMHS